jgi:4-amino-4-deoxy-L-arabinose transferase-like glycosyltransferase
MTREIALPLSRADAEPATELSPLDRRVFGIAAGLFALLMAFSTRYGFHEDELYFLDCARHLALSYVDQPVFTPLVARLSLDLFGVSLIGLRLWPALAGFGTVVIGGLLAREFGGGKRAQLMAALAVATSPDLISADHILGTTCFDLLAWSALALVVVRMGRTGDTRLWLIWGAVLGLGLTNKHLIAFFAVALLIGIVLSGGSHLLANRHFVIGVLIAAAFTVPDVWWQAHHDWATIAMTRSLAAETGGFSNSIYFVLMQLFAIAPLLIFFWLTGLRFLWESESPLWRALAWSYGLLFVFFAATSGGRPYYLAAPYFFLVAAGAVVFERRWAARPRRTAALFGLALPVYTLFSLVIALPVLPAQYADWTEAVNTVSINSIGWPELVNTVADVWHGLPAAERAHAVIYTAGYPEAGAINELGRADHLPEAVSGHNNEWWWGPGNPQATIVVAVIPAQNGGVQLAQLRKDFAHVQAVATITNSVHVNNDDSGGHVYLCTGPVRSWGSLWPSLRHYD